MKDELLKVREPLVAIANNEHHRKNCPFCGWKTTFVDGGYSAGKGEWRDWWLVQCLNTECGIWASGTTPQAAAEKWNKRVESDQARIRQMPGSQAIETAKAGQLTPLKRSVLIWRFQMNDGTHECAHPGLTMGDVTFDERVQPDGITRYWHAKAPIGSIFGSEVEGSCEGFGRTKEQALERLQQEIHKLHESLWF